MIASVGVATVNYVLAGCDSIGPTAANLPAPQGGFTSTGGQGGGPPVVAPVAVQGFGSKLVHRSMAAQLGGTIAFDWADEGLVVTLRMGKDRLAL